MHAAGGQREEVKSALIKQVGNTGGKKLQTSSLGLEKQIYRGVSNKNPSEFKAFEYPV